MTSDTRRSDTAARRREIAARYNRAAAAKRESGSTSNFRRAELRKLFRRRLGEELNSTQLWAKIEDAAGIDWPSLAAADLGHRIRLTLAEREFLDIRTIAPYDVSYVERQEHYREKKRERDREGARFRRAALRGARPVRLSRTARRAKKLATVLRADTGRSWWSITRLREAVRETDPFTNLSAVAARRAIARALEELCEAGQFEMRKVLGHHRRERLEFRHVR